MLGVVLNTYLTMKHPRKISFRLGFNIILKETSHVKYECNVNRRDDRLAR